MKCKTCKRETRGALCKHCAQVIIDIEEFIFYTKFNFISHDTFECVELADEFISAFDIEDDLEQLIIVNCTQNIANLDKQGDKEIHYKNSI